jgi:hypothetical protein
MAKLRFAATCGFASDLHSRAFLSSRTHHVSTATPSPTPCKIFKRNTFEKCFVVKYCIRRSWRPKYSFARTYKDKMRTFRSILGMNTHELALPVPERSRRGARLPESPSLGGRSSAIATGSLELTPDPSKNTPLRRLRLGALINSPSSSLGRRRGLSSDESLRLVTGLQ